MSFFFSLFFASLLIAILLTSWGLTLFSMPGNWVMVAATAVYVFFMPSHSCMALGWPVVGILVGMACFGELLELLAGMAGAVKAGASRRSAMLALFGSMVGAFFGVILGLPIPVIGSVVGVLLFASVGAMAGAVLGEIWVGKNAQASWNVGKAAFLGRLIGTLGKLMVGAVMLATVLVALVLSVV
jgi:uncharacterized protein YqgC (DUF456 family)